MITGEIKNKIDQIWDTFFVAGITNPITVLEQMTYIFFMKLLDDKQIQEEYNARDWEGVVANPTYPEGKMWLNPETKQEIPYESLRWQKFTNMGPDNDIPDVIHRYLHLDEEANRSCKDQSFFVPVEEIRNNDYDLSINKYKEVERERVVYDSVSTILSRLDKSETEYIKGYSKLVHMLGEE